MTNTSSLDDDDKLKSKMYGSISSEQENVADDDDETGSNEDDNTTPLLVSSATPSSLLNGATASTALHRRGLSEFSFFTSSFKKNKKRGPNNNGPGHHRRQSNIAQLIGNIGSDLGTIVEGVQDDVTNAVHGQLQDIDDGRAFFLESGMTRSLAMIPTDLPDFLQEARLSLRGLMFIDNDDDDDDADDEEQPLSTKKKSANQCLMDSQQETDEDKTAIPPVAGIGAYIGLLAAVVAISPNSTALSLERGVAPALKLFWRLSAVTLVLSTLVLRQYYKNGGSSSFKEQLQQLSPSQWTTYGFAIICFTFQALCFNMALEYTSIGNVVIFANSQAVLLLLGKVLSGTPVLLLEGLGALVASGGAILCATSEEREEESADDEFDDCTMTLVGEVLAMFSALLGVGYLTFAKAVRAQMTNVTLFTFIVMISGSFLAMIFIIVTMGDVVTWDNDPYTGLLGWLNWRWDRLGAEVWIVLVCNLIGTMGFVRAMTHFDPIFIAVATLLEPMIASIIAVLMKVGFWPSPMGWLGNALVVLGTLAVVAPSAMRRDSSGGH